MKKLIVSLVALALIAAAGYAAYLYALSPETVICTRLTQLCKLDSPEVVSKCEGVLAKVTDVDAKAMREAATCIVESDSCGEATGCVVGASASVGFKELMPLMKGSSGVTDGFLDGVKRGAKGLLD